MINIGARIHQLRLKNDLTLEELASRTELTKGFLSQLERNLTSPSIQTLDDIAKALGINLNTFFKEDDDEQIIFKAEDAFIDQQKGISTYWLIPDAQKNVMEAIRIVLEPGYHSKEVQPHQGEEMGYVLSGKLYLVTQSKPKGYSLKKGDSFYLKANESHHLENRSQKKAECLWLVTPPEF